MSLTNLQTFIMITGLMGCLMTLVIFFLRQSYPKSIKGFDDWMLFPLMTFLTSALYSTQGRWHHLISMALPNFLFIITLLIQLRGTYSHFGRTLQWRWIIAIVLPTLVFALWTSGHEEYFSHRLIVVSALTTVILGQQLPLLWHNRKGSFATRFMLFTILIIVLVMLARTASAIVDPPQSGIFTYSPMQSLYLATYSFGVLLLSISCILLASEQLRREMERLLKFDALTGALTRRAGLEYGEDELARLRRMRSEFSVLMVDVDHFKDINDLYGHLVGDEVLANVVKKSEQVLRQPAAISRFGGEEFLVLLPNANLAQAFEIAKRIQHHLDNTLEQPKVTISVGVACANPHDSLYNIIGRADDALYKAKRAGRNSIALEEWAVPGAPPRVRNVSHAGLDPATPSPVSNRS